MPVKLIAVKCTRCGKPVEGKAADRVFFCDSCGTLHTRDDEGTRDLDYEVAMPGRKDVPPSGLMYVPFWRLDSNVTIHYERSEGGFFNKLFGKDWKGGRVLIYVPAVDWDPATYKHWASMMTANPPRYERAGGFGDVERLPVTLEEPEARQLADFTILTFEAEKPGVLQEISYDVDVNHASILYVPFLKGEGGLRVAL